MAKHLIAVMTLLSVFIAGCPQAKPEWHGLPARENTAKMAVPPPKPEPNQAEPTKIETPEDELLKTEPNEIQLSAVEPNAIEPNEVEPNYPCFRRGRLVPAQAGKAVTRQKATAPLVSALVTAEHAVVGEAEAVAGREPARRVFFHDKCADILNNFVDEDGMVDYRALRRKRLELKKLLDEFDELDPNEYNSWPKEDKIAFWINAYNIQMLNIMVDNYPIDASRILSLFWGPYSIRHIKGIWTDYKFMVMDEEFTLRQIQQRFFHKEFDEPMVYFALCYASLSSPPLRNEPYYGYKLSQQLEDQTGRFLSSGRSLKIDRDKQAVYLSAILQSTWHGQEFIDKFGTDKKFKDQQPATRAVLNFITPYITPQDVDFLEVENYSVQYMKYDWTLNDSSIK